MLQVFSNVCGLTVGLLLKKGNIHKFVLESSLFCSVASLIHFVLLKVTVKEIFLTSVEIPKFHLSKC